MVVDANGRHVAVILLLAHQHHTRTTAVSIYILLLTLTISESAEVSLFHNITSKNIRMYTLCPKK